MVQNVEQILSRGERIELLVDKTDTMASQATAFRRGARTVRRQMWWKNKRVLGLGILVALVRMPRFPHYSVPDMCVISGDSLDDYGPVLWCSAALRSEVKHVTSYSCLRFDLIFTVISFRPHVTRASFSYSYAFMSPVTSHSPSSVLSCCGALSAKLSEERDPDFVRVQRPCHECLETVRIGMLGPSLLVRSERTASTMFWLTPTPL
jgi:hypothetical protein